MGNTATDLVSLLHQRGEMLSRIVAAPTDASTLTEERPVSRSTIDRALAAFEEWELIVPDPDRIEPTLLARGVVTVYDDFEADVEIMAARATDGDPLWRTAAERTDVLKLVANRLDLLESAETPRDKRTLVSELPYARSTVDWAVRELESAGLIQRTAPGYTTTPIGQQIVGRYRTLLETFSDLLAVWDLIAHLPADCALPPSLFIGSDIERSDETGASRPLAGVRDRLDRADRVRAVLPALPNPQLLDVCHHQVVRHGATLELVTDPDLADSLTSGVPGPLAEMAAAVAGSFAGFTAPVPPFGLLLTDTNAGTTVSVVIYADRRAVIGAIHTETDAAVEWADAYYDYLRGESTEVTDDLRSAATANTMGPVPLSTVADPERLEREAEGFVQLTPAYFAQHTPAQPAIGWRAGFDLVDVHAGYAIDREIERDGTRKSLTDDLIERLSEGTDHAIIGPPGSGKSTVCKSVACRWYEQGIGAVFYRGSGMRPAFESPAVLSAQIRTATSEGHVLVVVEDATRAEANTIFRVMQTFRGTTMVTFLLDARAGEWTDPPAFPTNARLDAFRREAIETVTMPALDEPEAERFVQHFQDTVGHERDYTETRLLRGIGTEPASSGQTEASQPAELLLLLHRLTLHADPLAGDNARTPTTLAEDVQRTYEELRTAGDVTLDVGVLVNLLNATNIGVSPALVYALAEDRNDDDDDDDGGERVDAVHDALSSLKGRIIFERGDSDEDRYRLIHEAWSQLFLDYLLDAADTDRAASQRFGRCITALLALSDDPALRTRISDAVERDTTIIDRIESAPGEWADTIVEQIFHLGLARPGLAPLFGTTESTTIALPATSSPEMEPRCAAWRGRMYVDGGHLDRATREFELAIDLVDANEELSDQEMKVKAQSYKDRGSVAWRRGELDRAAAFLASALHSYQAIDDRLGEAACYANFGNLALDHGALDWAATCFERGLDSHRGLGASALYRAKGLNQLGLTTIRRGDFDRAKTYLERSIDIGRELDGYFGLAFAVANLGEVTRRCGTLDRAEEYYKQGTDIARNAGFPPGTVYGLLGLGKVALDRDDLETAVEYVQRGLDIARDSDYMQGRAQGYRYLGTISRKRNAFAAAEEHLTDALAYCRDARFRYDEAKTLVELGELSRCRDEPASAREHFEDAVERFRETGAVRDAVDALERLSETCERLDEHDAAIDHSETAIALAREAAFDIPHAARPADRQRTR